jgi:hypothetical protein
MDNNAMNKKETTVLLKCDCGCSMLVVDKEEWEDGEVNYNISVQDSRYDHNYTTPWGRIKSAAKVLFGRPVYYSDIYIACESQLSGGFVEKSVGTHGLNNITEYPQMLQFG